MTPHPKGAMPSSALALVRGEESWALGSSLRLHAGRASARDKGSDSETHYNNSNKLDGGMHEIGLSKKIRAQISHSRIDQSR
jgi:hypothetical protein